MSDEINIVKFATLYAKHAVYLVVTIGNEIDGKCALFSSFASFQTVLRYRSELRYVHFSSVDQSVASLCKLPQLGYNIV
jgi:hypothetical protein